MISNLKHIVFVIIFLSTPAASLYASQETLFILWANAPSTVASNSQNPAIVKRELIGSWVIKDSDEADSLSVCMYALSKMNEIKARNYHKRELIKQMRAAEGMLSEKNLDISRNLLHRNARLIKQKIKVLPYYEYGADCEVTQPYNELRNIIDIDN